MSISFDRVSYTYPGATRPSVAALDVTIQPGAITLVTGPLGAGASTMLLLAAGLAPRVTGGTRAGQVTTLGSDPGTPAGSRQVAGKIGLLLPTPWTQLSGMAGTVFEEVAFGPANHGWDRKRIGEAVEKALDQAGVSHLAARDPASLSGGELQRVMVAALLVSAPEVLLLDEPALELDPDAADRLYILLAGIAATTTVVIASTDVDRLAEIAGRVLLLREGQCIADGVPRAVLGSETAEALGCATTVAGLARRAGFPAPYPVLVRDLEQRMQA